MKLEIQDVKANIEEKEILTGVSLEMNSGEVHALMGPNGSGKSTLSNVLFGNPQFTQTGGKILVDGTEIQDMPPDERARLGLFMAFQYPVEIPGVTVGRFLRRATELNRSGEQIKTKDFIKELRAAVDFMEFSQQFINRYLNEGFSGGEKKRMEVLQMMLLKPKIAILDETDSGLDIDALKIVSNGVNHMRKERSDFGALIITHYQRILDYITPDHVHIMYKGKIVTSGGPELVHKLEERGYDWVKKQFGEDGEE